MQDIWKALLIQYGWRHQALTDLNMSDGPFFTRSRKDSTFHRGKGNQVEWNHMWDEKGGGAWCEARKIFWAERRGGEQRERWWIEHEKIMRNEILFNKMSSLRQWSGEHCCHFTEIVTIDEFHLQRHQFLGCSISWIFAAIEAGFENLVLKADRVSAPMRQLWHWDEGWIGGERACIFGWRLLAMNISYYCWYSELKGKKMPLWVCCLASYMPAVKPTNRNTDKLL